MSLHLLLLTLVGMCAAPVSSIAVPEPAPQATRVTTSSIGRTSAPSPTIANACAQISPATRSFLARSPLATPTIPATLAYQCLQSVPNKPGPAKKLITSLKAYASWQSTLAWLKDPPASYMLPATDILGGLDNISTTAVAGGFASEYDFQLAILELYNSAHDGHFGFRPDVFLAFIFGNSLLSDLVSVSRDGKEVPKLYHYSDLIGNSSSNGTLPAAITKINGQDAASFIEKLGLKYSTFQDPDSQWNAQFPTYADPFTIPIAAQSLFYQGPSVTVTYDNGKERTQDSVAVVRRNVNFAGVRSGEDFYNKFCRPLLPSDGSASPTSSRTTTSTPTAGPAPTISGYPYPVVRDSGANVTAGYFLNGTGYDDVAVLAVSAFAPPAGIPSLEYLTNFQDTVEKFLAECKQAGKKRLVIDVTANGGGFIVAGFELFAQLFPDADFFQANNIRETPGVEAMARITVTIPSELPANASSTEQEAFDLLQNNVIVSNLIPGGVYSPSGQRYTTVDEILAPVVLKNDRFTAYQQTPLNQSNAQFNLTGTGNRANPQPAVFAPADVVILTDGTCGSTCTLFSYLMMRQLNVSTTVVGGRPQVGQMQSVAGVEGAQLFPMLQIQIAAAAVLTLGSGQVVSNFPDGRDELAILAEGYALGRSSSSSNPGSVNGKNAFSKTDAQTPLQFIYEPANCRFFYTAEMIRGPELVWKKTVDATWKDPATFCVEGSRVAASDAASSSTTDPRFSQTSAPSKSDAGRMFVPGSVGLSVVVATFVVLLSLV